ncbi:MAG TPA: hypothetical protein P5219_10225, partial [Aminivibrio sp.]|nr:hypothetical protein [Aminivibrio sp.]
MLEDVPQQQGYGEKEQLGTYLPRRQGTGMSNDVFLLEVLSPISGRQNKQMIPYETVLVNRRIMPQ